MAETWDKMGVRVCYCFREEDGLEPFFNFLENAAENSTECRVPGEEEMKALKNELMKYDKENA
jgi:hypothetical protein